MDMIQKVLQEIPDYDAFLTVEEMDKSSIALAEQYPELVELFVAGTSRDGNPLYCLKIGKGGENVLLYGCPHPNEPIGAMMLEYLSWHLAENDELRVEMKYTFYIIKSVDPDGTKRNEGWFKGPFTVSNYARHFYRPESIQQTDWTFPIAYKRLKFDSPMPETEALIRIIEEKRPIFIYPLHNAGFGGTYWYLNREIEAVYPALLESTKKANIPANLGESEMPFIQSFAPAIFKMVGVKQMYDHMERYAEPGTDFAGSITNGTSSVEFAEEFYSPYAVITELPYFLDDRIADMSETDITRKAAAESAFNYQRETFELIEKELKALDAIWDKEGNPFYRAIQMYLKIPLQNETTRKMMAADPQYNQTATVAECFDLAMKSKFYMGILPVAMLWRAVEMEMETKQALDDKGQAQVLQQANGMLAERFERIVEEIDQEFEYRVVPIRDMIRVQLETGLIILQHLQEHVLKGGEGHV